MEARELDETPTWAVAGVVAIIIIISIMLEKVLHKVGEVFQKKRNKALFEALEKVKGELMILGFISLLLTFGQSYIVGICIREETASQMLPCQLRTTTMEGGEHALPAEENHGPATEHHPPAEAGVDEHPPAETGVDEHPPVKDDHHSPEVNEQHLPTNEHRPPEDEHHPPVEEHHLRRLLWDDLVGDLDSHDASVDNIIPTRRMLSGDGGNSKCAEGTVPLVSSHAIHQLHIFIFFLAVFHVIYSCITMALGRLKALFIEELPCRSVDGRNGKRRLIRVIMNFLMHHADPARFRFAHETSFVRVHTSFWTRLRVSFYILSFFRQFFRSVRKTDYLTIRHGFIAVHLAPGTKFNFQNYIKRTLEDDFKVVVGISPILWGSVVFFLLFNVNGWHTQFLLSLIPLIIILSVGTKLQAIIMNMALEIQERHAVVQGIPLVQVSDEKFWFCRPQLVLSLIHFVLFQNAFQITYFFWISYEFGFNSCFHANFTLVVTRLVIGVGVLFLCSYITLPVYALVSQMGSQMKKTIFDEQTSKALMKWHQAAKKKQGPQSPKASVANQGTGGAAFQMQTLHPVKSGKTTTSHEYSEMDENGSHTPTTPPSSIPNLL